MKRTLSIAVSLLALCAFAEEPVDLPSEEPSEPSTPQNVSSVPSANVFGVMMVSGSCRRYILPTPWCDFKPGEEDAPIVASNLLKTANLDVGDMLHLFDEAGNIYNSWKLEVVDGLRYWAPVSEVSEMGVASDSPSVSSKTSPQGYAFMLLRYGKDGSASGVSSEFYLFGQVGHDSEVGTTIPAGGTEGVPLMRLIACPKAASWGLNNAEDVVFQEGQYKGDMIRIATPSGVIMDYYWCNSEDDCNFQASKIGLKTGTWTSAGWYAKSTTMVSEGGRPPRPMTTFALSTAKIRCGFGGWYLSYSGISRDITWKNVQKQL